MVPSVFATIVRDSERGQRRRFSLSLIPGSSPYPQQFPLSPTPYNLQLPLVYVDAREQICGQ